MVGRSLVAPPWALVMQSDQPCVLAAVLRGDAWVRHGDVPPVHLSEASVIVGCGHVPLVIGDHPATVPHVLITDRDTCSDPITGESVADRNRSGTRTWGDPDAPTAVVLGAYRTGGELYAQLARDLPDLVVVGPDPAVRPVLDALAAETTADRPGQQVVVDRLMELLLFAAIRTWLASPAARVPAWSSALADPIIGPALRALHAEPERRWTVAGLAGVVATSRTAFAVRFRELVGEPPFAHLTRWRMALAADALRADPARDLTTVARSVGYADAFSFSTAFRRVRGVSPSGYRRSAWATGSRR